MARAGDFCAGRLIHERHEFVREARHGAANADAAHVGASADARHPAALGHVAIHHGPPAAELDDALRGAVGVGKVALLVIAGAIATFMNGLSEEPCRAELIVERNHGGEAGDLIQKIKNRLHEVIRLNGTAGDIHDGEAGL